MAMPQNHAQSYLAAKVMTASPAELRLMLIEGSVRFARQGRDSLASKDFEGAFNGFTRCRAIIVELMTTMRTDVGDPEIVESLRALYGYMITRLLTASHEKNLDAADEVIKLLDYERETWVMLMSQLVQEQRSALTNADAVADAVAGVSRQAGAFQAHG